MSRRALAIAVLLLMGLTALTALFATPPGADASTLSAGASGWLGFRGYLEARGASVRLLDAPDAPAGDAVLVLGLPWQRFTFEDLESRADRHLADGGTVVAAFSGARLAAAEDFVADALDLDFGEPRGNPPLHPLRWRAFARAEWTLWPEPPLAPGPAPRPIRVAAPRRYPRPPAGARVLHRGGEDVAMVFAYNHLAGTVVVVPADALSNARLSEPGNADLAEWLLHALGREWAFDEYHHGLVPERAEEAAPPARAMNAFLLQLALLYALAIFAVSRRFGPAWVEPPVVASSTAAFLSGLGAMHDRLRHHRDAARLLVARVAELDPRLLRWAARTAGQANAVRDGMGLLALAREAGSVQAGREELR